MNLITSICIILLVVAIILISNNFEHRINNLETQVEELRQEIIMDDISTDIHKYDVDNLTGNTTYYFRQ